jgi:hypothetical protein
MITRRRFIAATATSPLALPKQASASPQQPLKAEPRVRTLHWRETEDRRIILFSDGSPEPSKLIKDEVLDRMFGSDTHLVLQQPDHWRMIEEGWFNEEDLYQPTDIDDPAYRTWHANYKPEVEAHDLLYDLFQDRISGPFGAIIPELGLVLAEHPTTPRLALAKLNNEWCLPSFVEEVTRLTRWLNVDLTSWQNEAML